MPLPTPAPSLHRPRERAPLLHAIAAALAVSGCAAADISKPAPGAVFVTIHDNAFQPDTVTVTAGTSVRWTNAGTAQHTVASDAVLWASELLPPGWWFEVRFDSAGTFGYHCTAHAETGTVIVQ
jgi:plastocyanin